MSTLICPVIKLSNYPIIKHPDADSLSIVNYNVEAIIIKSELFENEDFGVFIPIDTIGKEEGSLVPRRIVPMKLRGVLSHGLILPWGIVEEYFIKIGMSVKNIAYFKQEGINVAGPLRLTKYQNTVKGYRNPDAIDSHESFNRYIDIEHYRNHIGWIPFGSLVQISAKLHGANFRAGLIENKLHVGSRNLSINVKSETSSIWSRCFREQGIDLFLNDLKEHFNIITEPIIVYGEVVGRGVQTLHYGFSEPYFFVFDIQINGVFLHPGFTKGLCDLYEIDHVPILKFGPFAKEDLELRNGFDFGFLREGIVIKQNEVDSRYGMRTTLKLISAEYNTKELKFDKIYE